MTACPVCGENASAPVAGPFREWRYVRCAGCAHCRLIPMPGEDYLGAYYNSAYRVPPERYFAAARREVPLVRRMLARRHSSRGCLLEVGASYGAMLAALRDDGWDVIGTELDRRAAEQAHARYGIDVRFEALAVVPDKGPLDAVVLFHVIEHLPEPEAFLVALRAQLKCGGTLLLKTPNGGSWLAEHVQGWWEWFAPPEHVHVFSPVSLDLVLKRAGFVPDYTTTRLGDAHPVTFELLRVGARRALGRGGEARPPASGGLPPSQRAWYAAALESIRLATWPLEALLERAWARRLRGPELLVAARAV